MSASIRSRRTPPLEGITQGGYKLVYTEEPGKYWKSRESSRHQLILSYSLGLAVGKDGQVVGVVWDGPAFNAGITVGSTLTAIDGEAYSDDDLKAAITAAKGGSKPIALLIKQNDSYRTVSVQWNGGLRYPAPRTHGQGSRKPRRALRAAQVAWSPRNQTIAARRSS